MSVGRLKRVSRSLLGQMSALAVIFLMFTFIYFAVMPYLQYRSENGPLERTRTLAGQEILSATYEGKGRSIDTLGDSEILSEIAAANEEFRYYVRRGDKERRFGGVPKWQGAIDFSHPDLESFFDAADNEDCATSGFWSGEFDDDGVATHVYYRVCNGEITYVEYAGIAFPVARAGAVFALRNLQFFWWTTWQLFTATLAFILIAGFVLLLATRSLRRVTRVAESFDASQLTGQRLPEGGIPTEVLPLVRAINDMVRRVHESQEQQHFFLATAAHEMRTPMAIVRTRLEELPDSQTKEELRDDVRRMTTLVEQLLRLMNIQNRDRLPDEVDLVALARKVVAERAPLAIDHGVEIELESDTEHYVVKGDEGLLHVALANLVDNAISFSSAGDAVLIRVDRTGTIAVQDQGPGIAEEEIEAIFEPFAKSPPNRKGHGLGLAIVRAIMSLHGGDVSTANAAGGGARFALQF